MRRVVFLAAALLVAAPGLVVFGAGTATAKEPLLCVQVFEWWRPLPPVPDPPHEVCALPV